MSQHLSPPPNKGHLSVARLANYWYVACQSTELKRKPLARTILGTPLVLFRNHEGSACALLDRCPHRNAPLSLGSIANTGNIQCAYHGWQINGQGQCQLIPGLIDTAAAKQRQCPHLEVCEQEGLVWVYPALDETPDNRPFHLGLDKLSDHTIVVRQVDAKASLHATLENALDVPHTAFLHQGLFRCGARNKVRVRIARTSLGVEAEYIGEPRPSGIIGRVLSPGGGIVEHWDRFLLPSIAQVEYRLGTESHFVVTALCTPVSDFHTHLTAVAAFRTPLPALLLKPLLTSVGVRIFEQDARILRAQTENIRHFGGEQFMSSELDMLGPHIWWLLRQAERGESTESTFDRELTFMA